MRVKHLLSAESACNDDVSFPFLYIKLVALKYSSVGEAIKERFLITVLWQCAAGIAPGLIIGNRANRLLRFSDERGGTLANRCSSSFTSFSPFSVGVGSTPGSDDFLVAFGSGVGFPHDGWFAKKTKELSFSTIIDIILNSSMFVFFGFVIPWRKFLPHDVTPNCGPWKLTGFLILVRLFRRIPIVLAMKWFIPDIRTYREALFCGHFGPMGVGAWFLAMEARGELALGDV